MKKKILLCAALLGTSYFAVAQSGVGVGVALPHGSAMLDIEASDKGVSLPNVELTSLSEKGPIAMEPKDGLLVYNTVADSTKDLIKGFYYWGDRDGAKGWLPIAANQSVVLTKDGDNYYFAQGDVTLNLSEEVNKTQKYALVIQQTAEENQNNVLLAKKFNDGKGDSADVLLTETLTSITKGKTAGTEQIIYTYTDETGVASTELAITSDVIESFEEIINHTNVTTLLNTFISESTGEVVVSKDVDENIIISYKNGDKTETLNLTSYIKENQVFASAGLTAAVKGTSGAGLIVNPNKEDVEATTFVETLTSTSRIDAKGEAADITAAPGTGLTYYEYKDESGDSRYLTVSQDVSNDFEKIVANNEDFTRMFVRDNAPVASFRTNNPAINQYEKPGLDLIFNSGLIEGTGHDFEVKETTTKLLYDKIDLKSEDPYHTHAGISYEYRNETGERVFMRITRDVSDTFDIIMRSHSARSWLDAYERSKVRLETKMFFKLEENDHLDDKDWVVYATFPSGDGEDDEDNGEFFLNFTEYVNYHQTHASMELVEPSKGYWGTGFEFNNNDIDGNESFEFKETRTLLNRFSDSGLLANYEEDYEDPFKEIVGLDLKSEFTYYTFTDESGVVRYLPVSQDVSEDFEKIVEKNKAYLASFVKTAAGNVKVVKEGDDVVFVINEGETTEEKLNITQLVKDSSFVASISTQEATENTAGVGLALKFSDGKQVNPTELSFAETLTSFSKAKDANDFTEYTYSGEAGIDEVKLSVSQDVSDDFEKIVEKNKEVIENIAKTVGANPWNVQGGDDTAVNNTDNIYAMGSVVIGSKTMLSNDKATNAKLSVEGDVVVNGKFFSANSVYADYVFENYFTGSSDYNLTYEFKSLDYVKDFVEKYNHLPGVTKISDVERTEDGKYLIDFSELSMQQLEKIEELYLHTIEQQEDINTLKRQLEALKSDVELLKASFQTFKNK